VIFLRIDGVGALGEATMARIAMACIALLGLLVVACGTSKVEVDDTAGVEEIAEVVADTEESDVCQPDCFEKE